MKSLKKKGFSLIEVMIAMAILGIIASQTIPLYVDNLTAERKQVISKDIVAYTTITEKIMSLGYYAPTIDFTSSKANNKVYKFDTDEGETYTYPLITSNINFKQYAILDPESEEKNEEGEVTKAADYLSYGIILKFNSDPKCLVFNKIYDAKPYWSYICDPDNLNWKYSS